MVTYKISIANLITAAAKTLGVEPAAITISSLAGCEQDIEASIETE